MHAYFCMINTNSPDCTSSELLTVAYRNK